MSSTLKEYNDLLNFFSQKSVVDSKLAMDLAQLNSTTTTMLSAGANFESNAIAFANASINTISRNKQARSYHASALKWLIPCYSVILLFAVVGNLLVISTLAQNRRMRTITNVFLLNLAISDMLLGVLCMPVTLVGTLLRQFIFSEFLCKLIQFSQAASVAVSSWTLVAISCERYYAICHPLRSRTWQTISHAYKIIACIWFGSIICMTPIAIFSQLMPTSRQGMRKCREHWPENTLGYERSYNILLDIVLLVLPLVILSVTYIQITRTLYVGMKNERALLFGSSPNKVDTIAAVTTTLMPSSGFKFNMSLRCPTRSGACGRNGNVCGNGCCSGSNSGNADADIVFQPHQNQNHHQQQHYYDDMSLFGSKRKMLTVADGRNHMYTIRSASVKSFDRKTYGNGVRNLAGAAPSPSMTVINVPQQQRFQLYQQRHQQQQQQLQQPQDVKRSITEAALRRSNESKNLQSKKRVVKMLFVLVLEFFICWTPLYVINTLAMFMGPAIYEYIDYTSISIFQLLAYSSSCCNPITYCFMNASFRRAFLHTFSGLQLNRVRFWRRQHKNDTNLSVAGNSINMGNSSTVMSTMIFESPRL